MEENYNIKVLTWAFGPRTVIFFKLLQQLICLEHMICLNHKFQIERSLNHIWKWLENSNGQRKVDYLVGTGNYCLRNDVCTILFWRSNLCQKKKNSLKKIIEGCRLQTIKLKKMKNRRKIEPNHSSYLNSVLM